ncbi:MAG: hypothetical protein DHS20C16_19120 [Phycisphaerae bacterium]|nr:MAG: hypothetical protein DHS20C16_19120 [Phycisphaerae bacterium]
MTYDDKNSFRQATEIVGLLSRQLSLYDQLTSLADKQRKLVAAEDTRPLMKVLAQRQRLTIELEALNARMAPLRDTWPTVREGLDSQDRTMADDLISKVNTRLKTLLDGDAADVEMLQLRKQRVGTELGTVRNRRKAVAAYQNANTGNPTNFDRLHNEV